MANSTANDIITMAEGWFSKAPSLPPNAKEILVKIMPWIALIFGALGLFGGIAGLGLLTAFLPAAALGGVPDYGGGYIAAGFMIASSVLMLMAYPGLQARKMRGWTLLFWSEVLSLVFSVISLALLSVVWALIGFYLLFQIKPHYK